MLLHLSQVSVCLASFYGIYYLIFHRFSFFRLNRFYLLSILVLSFAIPQITFEKEVVITLNRQNDFTANNTIDSVDNQKATESINQIIVQKENDFWDNLDWMMIAQWIYLGVVSVLTIRFAFMLFQILKLKQKAYKAENYWFVETQSKFANASFFNLILLNSNQLTENERQQIIAHECTHARLGHSFDRLIAEFTQIILWFNPVIYFYKNSLNQVHEYEVDAQMIQSYDTKQYANLLLKLSINSHKSFIINQFSTHPLKDRIRFILSKPTSNMKKLFYFLTIPMVAVGIGVFAKESTKLVYSNTQKVEKEYPQPEKSPLKVFTTNENMKNTPLYSFTEKNLSLNELYTLPQAIYYTANPNFFTLEMIDEVNHHLVKKGFKIIVAESSKNLSSDLISLKLGVRNQKTNKISRFETIDMAHAREVSKKGAVLGFDIYNNHFNDSGFYLLEGNSDLVINRGMNRGFVNSQASNLILFDNQITYYVSPDRVKTSTLEEVAKYFKNAGFELSISDVKLNNRNLIQNFTLELSSDKETKRQTFDLNMLRHVVQYKNEKPSKWDETIVVSGNLKTKQISLYIENRWLMAILKNGAYKEIKPNNLGLNNENTSKTDSVRTLFQTHKLGKNPLVIINGQVMPASSLYRINPFKIKTSSMGLPNNLNAMKRYGPKAADGFIELTTHENPFLEDEQQYRIVAENVKAELNIPDSRIVRIKQKNLDGTEYEKVIVRRLNGDLHGSVDVPLGGKVYFSIDDKQVSEKEILESKEQFVGISTWENKPEDMSKLNLKYNGGFNFIRSKK